MSTITLKSAAIEVEGGSAITVRRLNWKNQRDLLKKLALLLRSMRAGTDGAAPVAESSLGASNIMGMLPELLTQSEELTLALGTGSTGLSEDDFNNLDSGVALEVLRVALEINFDQEFTDRIASIFAAIADRLPKQTT